MNPDALHDAYRYQMLAYREWRELAAAGKLNPAQRRFFEPRAAEALPQAWKNDPSLERNRRLGYLQAAVVGPASP